MKKEAKTWGNSIVLTFDKEERKIHKIKEGDIFEVNKESSVEEINQRR